LERVFVTGASGFLGSRLLESLASEELEVVAACRTTSRLGPIPARCVVKRVDFMDPRALERLLPGVTTIYHLAGATAARSQEQFDLSNAAVTRSLLAARSSVAPDALFVYVSSQSACGPCREGPITPYGRSKLMGEVIVRRSENWVIVRPPAVFGPGDEAAAPLFRLARRGLMPVPLKQGSGFSLIFVDDLVDLLRRLGDSPGARGMILEPSYGKIWGWNEFRKVLERAAGRRILPVPVPARLVVAAGFVSEAAGVLSGHCPVFDRHKGRELVAEGWTADASSAKRATGWTPATRIEDALRLTLESCRPRKAD